VSARHDRPLRVFLLADAERMALVAPVVRDLGHVATCDLLLQPELDVANADADVAIVAIGSGSARTLPVVERAATTAPCPVVVCLAEADEAFIGSTADNGVLTCVVGRRPDTWRKVIELALRPFADYQHLLEGLRRRAVIERAKGVLMERLGAREESAFELIRMEARSTNRRAVDVAQAFLDGDPALSGTGRRRTEARWARRAPASGGRV
jgi:AmiR/NasT family two-component response regulator